MATNLDRFKIDLDALLERGRQLEYAMQYACEPGEFAEAENKEFGKGAAKFLKDLPSFDKDYQRWYSEALAMLRQLLPDRVADFVRHLREAQDSQRHFL